MADGLTPGQRRRLQVTITHQMRLALEWLTETRGGTASSNATMLLRGALDKTIALPEVQDRIKHHVAQRTAREWRDEQQQEWVVEKAYAKEKAVARASRDG